MNRTTDSKGSQARSADRIDRWLIVVAVLVWFLPAALAALHTSTRARLLGDTPLQWPFALVRQLPFWAPLAAVAPFVLWFVRRLPFDRHRWVRSALLHTLFALGVGVTIIGLTAVGSLWFRGLGVSWPTVRHESADLFLWRFHLFFVTVSALIGGAYAIENYRRFRHRERQAARLREGLLRARLSNLEAQVRPHFLFNTLHSISCLVEEDREDAQQMIASLGDLLRFSLSCPSGEEVELDDELAGLDLYLQIETVRFQNRLQIVRSIEPEARRGLVPHLLLQPLVENAIHHGIARHPGAGRLELTAGVGDGVLRLTVSNDGSAPEPTAGERIGLGNTRERLVLLYGDRATLRLEPRQPHGARVIVTVPFRRSVESQKASGS